MSFGCYPGQQEYDYQAEYEITASDQGHNPSRKCKYSGMLGVFILVEQ
jgi:hypothetical protein